MMDFLQLSFSSAILSLFSVLSFYVFLTSIYRLTLHPLSKYPGPFLAKLTDLYAVYHAYTGDLHLDMWKCHQIYGSSVRYGPNKVIFNTNTALETIYSRSANIKKARSYRAFKTIRSTQDMLSTQDKADHSRKRRVISQAFSISALKSFEIHIIRLVGTFIGHVTPTTAEIEQSDKDGWSPVRDMAKLCDYFAFDTMSELVFGKPYHMMDLPMNRFIISLIKATTFRVGVYLQIPQLAIWNLDKILTFRIRKLREQLVKVSRGMAIERMNMDSKRQDLFSHILAARDPDTGIGFSMDEIASESHIMIIAGSDATSTGLAGCFSYLTLHLEAYGRLYEEIRGSFSSLDEIRSGPKLTACVYLRACIDESLRMSPPVGGAPWREILDRGLTIDGNTIPPGYDVGVGTYALHHNPVYYPDPFVFRPDRWIPTSKEGSKESVDQARSAFSAFSIGPRGCVGKQLAYLEMSLALARVIWKLDMEFVEGFGAKRNDREEERMRRKYPEHAGNEYRLKDQFTSFKEDLGLRFRLREQSPPQVLSGVV